MGAVQQILGGESKEKCDHKAARGDAAQQRDAGSTESTCLPLFSSAAATQ